MSIFKFCLFNIALHSPSPTLLVKIHSISCFIWLLDRALPRSRIWLESHYVDQDDFEGVEICLSVPPESWN